MTPELDKQLCEKYPKIFRDRYGSPQETCLYWGLEIGDGWYDIIDTLCTGFEELYTTTIEVSEEDGIRLGIEPCVWKSESKSHYYFQVLPPKVIATQVKEKFGTLRFYYRTELDQNAIDLIATGKYPELEKQHEVYTYTIEGMVRYAETASSLTCSISGAKGEMHHRNGWMKTLSPEVAAREPYLGYVPWKGRSE